MTKPLTITTVLFGLLGALGCGARAGSAPGGSYQTTPKDQKKPCLEVKVVTVNGTSGGRDPDGGDEGRDPGGTRDPDLAPESCSSGGDPTGNQPPPQVFDLRVGASRSRETAVFDACVETLFVGPFSAEMCGSGRGLFRAKRDPAPELTGYRVRLRWARASWGRLWLVPTVQAGMSELRVGTGEATYLPGRGSSRQLALGPAAGAALQLLWPLGHGLELVGDLRLEAAWIPGAGELLLPQESLQPGLGATLGIGF